MKCPLRPCTRLLRAYVVEILLIAVACLKERFEIVLLDLLPNDLLQRLCLKNLICLLLGPQFDQQGLIDPLKGGHLRVLCRIGRMRRSFELADVGFTLCGICADCSDRLQIASIYRVREIDRCPLRSDCLLTLCAERGIAGRSG